jgi:hypothetical protein
VNSHLREIRATTKATTIDKLQHGSTHNGSTFFIQTSESGEGFLSRGGR